MYVRLQPREAVLILKSDVLFYSEAVPKGTAFLVYYIEIAHKTCQTLPSLLCKREFCKENCAKVLTSKLGCAILSMSRKLGEMFGQ